MYNFILIFVFNVYPFIIINDKRNIFIPHTTKKQAAKYKLTEKNVTLHKTWQYMAKAASPINKLYKRWHKRMHSYKLQRKQKQNILK